MNYLKQNPVGLDAFVQKLQVLLHTQLLSKWSELNGYGRCYINQHDGFKTIEDYSKKNEYSGNLVFSEGNKFFFATEKDLERTGNGYYKTSIDLFFIVNVNKIYPSIAHRADEEIRIDVLNVLENQALVEVKKLVIDIDKIFNKFDYNRVDNMQPYHVFKLELDVVEFDINQKDCIN
jgi:hypothetical protein